MDRPSSFGCDDDGSSVGSHSRFQASDTASPSRQPQDLRRTTSKNDARNLGRTMSKKDATNLRRADPPPAPPARSSKSSQSCQHFEGFSRPLLVTSSSLPNPHQDSYDFDSANERHHRTTDATVPAIFRNRAYPGNKKPPASPQRATGAAAPSNPTTTARSPPPPRTRRHQRHHSDMAGALHTSLELDSSERLPRGARGMRQYDPSASMSASMSALPARPAGGPPVNRGRANTSPEPVHPSPCALRVAPRAFPAARAASSRRVAERRDAGGGTDVGSPPLAPAGPDRTTAPRPVENAASPPAAASAPRRRRRRSWSSFLERLEERASSPSLAPRIPRRWRVALCVSLYVVLMTLNAEESGYFRRMGEGGARTATGGGERRDGREVAFGRQHGREVQFPPSPLDDEDRKSGVGTIRGASATTARTSQNGEAAGNATGRAPPDAAGGVPDGKPQAGGGRKRRRPAMAHARTAAQAGRMPLYGAPKEPALPNSDLADLPPRRHSRDDEVERFVLKDDEIPSYDGEQGVDLRAFASSEDGTSGAHPQRKGRLALLALGFLSWLALTALVLDAGCREVRQRFLYVRQRNLRAQWETRRSR